MLTLGMATHVMGTHLQTNGNFAGIEFKVINCNLKSEIINTKGSGTII